MALDNAVDTTGENAPRVDDAAGLPAVFHEDEWKSVARHYQFVLVAGAVLGVVALVVGWAVGAPIAGAFTVIGLVLGAYNVRKLWTDTTALRGEVRDARMAMGKSSLKRLGLVTLLAFLFALIYRDQGWTVFMGLVAFQLLTITVLMRPIKRAARVFG